MTSAVPAFRSIHNYDTGMVTKSANPRRLLYLVEWRKRLNVSPEVIAEAFEIERESVHRMEREQNRMNAEKIAKYAETLGIMPEQLWRPPPPEGSDLAGADLTAAEREVALSLISKLTFPSSKPKRAPKVKR
ncbi:helix-turn-helix transcriptional regulator [Mesorhizobium sp.]|uniref:helix-turn-helix domain-containing protein n=1 Tax=Mesorhizobium sp. TaxID=1871066 RepID=UPI0025F2F64B|nr:helix-turn-helix transcriptional regulator [Mesorhizobium sp.]